MVEMITCDETEDKRIMNILYIKLMNFVISQGRGGGCIAIAGGVTYLHHLIKEWWVFNSIHDLMQLS